MKTRERYSLPLICVLCMIAVAFAALFAPKAYADDEPVLTIQTLCGGEAVEGIRWQVYRIGYRNELGGFSLNDKFAASKVNLDDTDEKTIKDAANDIESFIFENSIEPDQVVVSSADGSASVTAGEAGVFFIRTNEADIGEYHYSSLPAIVEVTEEGAAVNPKLERETVTVDSSKPDESSKPEESSETDDNSRKSEGDGDHGRKTGEDDGTPKDNSNTYQGPLPQTGQLWWPVPIMAIAGMVLVALGLRLRSGKGGKDE